MTPDLSNWFYNIMHLPIKLAILVTLRRGCREGQDTRCSSPSLRALTWQKLPLVHSLTLRGPAGQPGSRRELVLEGRGEGGGRWAMVPTRFRSSLCGVGILLEQLLGSLPASLHERCSRAMRGGDNGESSPLTPGGLRLDPAS